LETSYDQVFIDGANIERRRDVPSSLSTNDVITWSSDGSVTQGGWQLCFSDQEPDPECTVDADCTNPNEICDTNRICVPAPECVNDSDCASGQTCESGTCVGTSEYSWFRIVGDCDVQQDNCVSSGNFPLAYGHNEDCTVTVLQDAFITPSTIWNLEEDYDHVIINGNDVESIRQVPSSLVVGDTIRWTSDVSISHEGWQLCFADTEPVPECVPDSDCPSGSICQDGVCMQGYTCEYFRMVGDCDTQNDNCVSSGNFPAVHGNNEECIVTVSKDSTVTPSSVWELENDYDHILINGVDVERRNSVPSTLSQDDVIRWESDGSVTNRGWQLCFTDTGGADSHYVSFGRSNEASTRIAQDGEIHAVRCVSDDNRSSDSWRTPRPSCSIWYESDVWGECVRRSWSEAETFCSGHGGRLPTIDEIESNCVVGSGCGYDRQLIWSSSTETLLECSGSSTGWSDAKCETRCNDLGSCHPRCTQRCNGCACIDIPADTCVSLQAGWSDSKCDRKCNGRTCAARCSEKCSMNCSCN